MSNKTWYLFSQGVTFGPLPTDVVKVMLKQGRVKVTEFTWTEGMERWERLRDQPEFATEKNLPPYPEVAIPPLQEVSAEAEEPEAEASQEAEAVGEPVPEAPESEEDSESEEEFEAEVAQAEEAEEAVEEEPAVAEAESEEAQEVEVPVAAAAAAPAPKPAPRPAPAKKPANLKLVKPAPAAKPAAKKPARPVAKAPAKPLAKAKPKKVAKPKTTIRGAERVSLAGTVEIEGVGAARIIDISETGVLVEAAELVDVGTSVEFVLKSTELETTPWTMTGIVARMHTESPAQFAIEFTRVNPAYKRSLTDVVKAKTQAQG